MFRKSKKGFTLSKIKEESNAILQTFLNFIQNTTTLFKKDEKSMTKEEKIEKQHIMTFLYGMVAGIIVYHFLVGVVLIAIVIALYGYSVQKTKTLISEEDDKLIIDAEIRKK